MKYLTCGLLVVCRVHAIPLSTDQKIGDSRPMTLAGRSPTDASRKSRKRERSGSPSASSSRSASPSGSEHFLGGQKATKEEVKRAKENPVRFEGLVKGPATVSIGESRMFRPRPAERLPAGSSMHIDQSYPASMVAITKVRRGGSSYLSATGRYVKGKTTHGVRDGHAQTSSYSPVGRMNTMTTKTGESTRSTITSGNHPFSSTVQVDAPSEGISHVEAFNYNPREHRANRLPDAGKDSSKYPLKRDHHER